MKEINVNLVNEIKDANIIDIREQHEYANGSVPGAINIPMQQLLANPKNYLNSTDEYYILCLSGGRSTMTCQMLLEKGFNNITNLSGGMMGYFGNL